MPQSHLLWPQTLPGRRCFLSVPVSRCTKYQSGCNALLTAREGSYGRDVGHGVGKESQILCTSHKAMDQLSWVTVSLTVYHVTVSPIQISLSYYGWAMGLHNIRDKSVLFASLQKFSLSNQRMSSLMDNSHLNVVLGSMPVRDYSRSFVLRRPWNGEFLRSIAIGDIWVELLLVVSMNWTLAYCSVTSDFTKFANNASISRQSMEKDRAMHHFGIDSLVTIELRNWFWRKLGADVPIPGISVEHTLEEIARTAVKKSKFARKVWAAAGDGNVE